MMSQQQIFFEFLRFCIGVSTEIPASVKEADWKVLYAIAKKQALLGVLFHGIKQLPKKLAPDAGLLMQWMGMAQRIRQQNIRLFMDSATVCEKFKREGFRNCILKGQGNALLYPDPYMRTPGDIDIYLAGGRERIMEYVDRVCPGQTVRYHHVDFPVMKTAIEVHFTPSYMFFPVHNRKMQRWFAEVMDLQCSNVVTLPDGYGEIAVPTINFNVVYILSHLYRHVFTEGIGLRQLLDYYFVLESLPRNSQRTQNASFLNTNNSENTEEAIKSPTDYTDNTDFSFLNTNLNRTNVDTLQTGENLCKSVGSVGENTSSVGDLHVVQRELKRLGLWKFAGAVMWVLHEVFGLAEEKMIAPMDEKEGKFLLEEIMRGGNFGQYDTRLGSKDGEGKIHRYFRMSLRNLRFVKHYPTEALSEPLFRTWYFFWKVSHGTHREHRMLLF